MTKPDGNLQASEQPTSNPELINDQTHQIPKKRDTKGKQHLVRSKTFHVSSRKGLLTDEKLSPNNHSTKNKSQSTSDVNSTTKQLKKNMPMNRCPSIEEILNAESRGKQIEKELKKHSLSEEEMNLLIIDLVQPLDIVGMILNRSFSTKEQDVVTVP